MQSPVDTLKQLATQFGWAEQVLGEQFWSNVLGNLKASGQQMPGMATGSGAQVAQSPRQTAVFPPLEIYTTGQEVVLTAALPGLGSPDHAAVYLTGPRELVLEAFVQPEPAVGMSLLRERPTGYFTRTVTLPTAVAPQSGRVRFADGLLEVRLPAVNGSAAASGISVIQVPPTG